MEKDSTIKWNGELLALRAIILECGLTEKGLHDAYKG